MSALLVERFFAKNDFLKTCIRAEFDYALPIAPVVSNLSLGVSGSIIELETEFVTEVFTGFGERGVAAEVVASNVIREVKEYLASEAPVGIHLADCRWRWRKKGALRPCRHHDIR